MKRLFLPVILLLIILFTAPLFADSFEFKGRTRTYVVSAPNSDKPLGVFILLHPNGGNGGTLIGSWAKIVHPDGVMCIGPNSLNQQEAWRDQENEGLDFMKALVNDVAKKYKIDRKRIYIGGYSAGACQACRVGIINSDYFAGIITYAGCSMPGLGPRKIAVALIHGEKDGNIKVDGTRQLYNDLKAANWPVWYKEIPGQGHSYNAQYNPEAWQWVKSHPPQDPPELIAKEKLSEAKEALEKKDYEKAYAAYKEALATGINKEEAEAGIKKIEEIGNAEIDEALKLAETSKSKAKNLLAKIKLQYKGTPISDKAAQEIEKLSEKKPSESEPQKEEVRQKEEIKKKPDETPITAERLMEKAENSIRAEMWEEARSYLEKLIKDFPDSPLIPEAKQKLKEIEDR